MDYGQPINVTRDVEAVEIPAGYRGVLPQGKSVRIVQSLGGDYTVITDEGHMLRIAGQDADAIGFTPTAPPASVAAGSDGFNPEHIWEQLRLVYDPEIPVNVVDLGLIYGVDVAQEENGKHRVDIKMTMTAPGCGMSDILKTDAHNKVAMLPTVSEVNVDIVFDPPWTPDRMSEAAKLKLGWM
ncbi:MAG TPA: putative Fe-S cluster assembly protein SufT [Terriglobales bacterium]|nr:putative Fe-S cluster assembly protein SufT [Terriglobales bacterium]